MDLSNTHDLQRPVLDWLINGKYTDTVSREVKQKKPTKNAKLKEVEYKGDLRGFIKKVLLNKDEFIFHHRIPQNTRITSTTVVRDLNKLKHKQIVSISNRGKYLIIKTSEPIKVKE